MLPQYFLFLLIPLKIAALYLATRGTLRGSIRPDRVSLALWSIPALLSFTIAFINGASWSAVPLLFAGAGPLVILFLTFLSRHKPWSIRTIDYMSAPFSLAAILFWILTDHPILAIVFAIIADSAAALPTIIKAWKAPYTESIMFYVLGGVSNAIGLATLPVWSFETAAFGIYLSILGIIMMIAIAHRTIIRLVQHLL